MKKNLYILIVFCSLSSFAFAQSGGKTIIGDLNSSKPGQGNIKVMQDEAIQSVVAIRHATDTTTRAFGLESSARNGYKILAYSGNNQQKSKREAESRQGQLKSAFPEAEMRVSFHSPFWRLYVGNYATEAEARELLKKIKEKYPSLGREMYVVQPNR